jgi:hypothetical protein
MHGRGVAGAAVAGEKQLATAAAASYAEGLGHVVTSLRTGGQYWCIHPPHEPRNGIIAQYG